MSHSDRKEAQGTPRRPSGPSPEKPPGERNDLVVEHWQAPNPSQLRGSSREIWEYESESDGPSKEFVVTVIVIVGGLVAALAFMGYVIFRFLASPP